MIRISLENNYFVIKNNTTLIEEARRPTSRIRFNVTEYEKTLITFIDVDNRGLSTVSGKNSFVHTDILDKDGNPFESLEALIEFLTIHTGSGSGGSGGGVGAFEVWKRKDNDQDAVFATFDQLESFFAGSQEDFDGINNSSFCAVVGSSQDGRVTDINVAYILKNGEWITIATNIKGDKGDKGDSGAGGGENVSNYFVPIKAPVIGFTDSPLSLDVSDPINHIFHN